jgi:hypothetical protein
MSDLLSAVEREATINLVTATADVLADRGWHPHVGRGEHLHDAIAATTALETIAETSPWSFTGYLTARSITNAVDYHAESTREAIDLLDGYAALIANDTYKEW